MRATVREMRKVPERTNTNDASARPSRYSSSASFGLETAMFAIGAPTRGTNSFFPECSCQMTSTASSPPLSKYAPFAVNAIEETVCACQCKVVVGAFFRTPEAKVVISSLRQYHSLMTPLASPVAKYSSVGWKARQVSVSSETNFVKPALRSAVRATYAL